MFVTVLRVLVFLKGFRRGSHMDFCVNKLPLSWLPHFSAEW